MINENGSIRKSFELGNKEMLKEMLVRLLDSGEYVDYGKDGVILRIDSDRVSDEDKEKWKELFNVDFSNGAAVKALKVFNRELAEKELNIQKGAFSVLGQGNEKRSGVPRVLVDEVLDGEIGEVVRSLIPHNMSQKTNFIIMEWVNGVDVATGIFRALWEYFQEKQMGEFSEKELYSKDVSTLAREVFAMMKLPVLDRGLENGVGEILLMNDLIKQLANRLRRIGKEINPFLILQIKNAVDALGKNGIHHNDLHSRNIICDGPVVVNSDMDKKQLADLKEETRSYVIDFGRSLVSGDDGFDSAKARQEGEALFNSWRYEGDLAERVLNSQETEFALGEWHYHRGKVESKLKNLAENLYPNFVKTGNDSEKGEQFRISWSQARKRFWLKLKELRLKSYKFSDLRKIAFQVIEEDEFLVGLGEDLKKEMVLKLIEMNFLERRSMKTPENPREFDISFKSDLVDGFFDDDSLVSGSDREVFTERVQELRRFVRLNAKVEHYSANQGL